MGNLIANHPFLKPEGLDPSFSACCLARVASTHPGRETGSAAEIARSMIDHRRVNALGWRKNQRS